MTLLLRYEALPIRVDSWNMLPTKERVGATSYFVVGVNGAFVLAWWIRYYHVDWLGNTSLEKSKVKWLRHG